MANNMTKYATANWSICSRALTACCKIEGRNRGAADAMGEAVAVVVFLVAFPSALLADEDDGPVEVDERDLMCWATM